MTRARITACPAFLHRFPAFQQSNYVHGHFLKSESFVGGTILPFLESHGRFRFPYTRTYRAIAD